MHGHNPLISIILAGVLLSACSLAPEPGPAAQPTVLPAASGTPAITDVGPNSSAISPTPGPTAMGTPAPTPDRTIATKLPERVSPEPGQPVTGEAPPDLLDVILDDLAHKTGAPKTSIQVVRSEAVVWNDGSLGCPQPDVAYTQALVEGYWVVLALDGREYDYRAGEGGYFLQCEAGLPPAPPVSTPSS